MWATLVIFKNLLKVNNQPLGENLPNLVTLLMVHAEVATYVRFKVYLHMYKKHDFVPHIVVQQH
jgi:hypothetical protein